MIQDLAEIFIKGMLHFPWVCPLNFGFMMTKEICR